MQDQNPPATPSQTLDQNPSERFQRLTSQETERAPPPAQIEGPWVALRIIPWSLTLLVGAAAVYFSAVQLRTNYEDQRLLAALARADTLSLYRDLSGPMPETASAAHFETVAEFALGLETPDIARAREAALRAIEQDPNRPFVWAILAYVEQQQSGRITAAALDHLKRSMDLCPLCDQELVRWRFNFVLANWPAMPEDIRRRAFDHADILRWSGQNAEFLAEMRIKAEAAGIPYAAYRAGVQSPVPSLDRGVASPRP
jgi:hypothetical protein